MPTIATVLVHFTYSRFLQQHECNQHAHNSQIKLGHLLLCRQNIYQTSLTPNLANLVSPAADFTVRCTTDKPIQRENHLAICNDRRLSSAAYEIVIRPGKRITTDSLHRLSAVTAPC